MAKRRFYPFAYRSFRFRKAETARITTVHIDRPGPGHALRRFDAQRSDRQDTSYLSAETRWAGWPRSQHDQVLDTLYTWSQKSAQNQAMFNQLFTLLQPAAVDLDKTYAQQQGMNTGDAEQATALAMMELLYQSTINFAPGLGGGPAASARYKTYAPRYPILANPQS
jgi:hypothetical protein